MSDCPLYEAKARAELAAADREASGSERIAVSGDLRAHVMLVKGGVGPAERAGGDALSGPDGDAARKVLGALGFDPDSVFATLSRVDSAEDSALWARRLRWQIEAVDPYAIVALDATAAKDLTAATGIGRLGFGKPIRHRGRVLFAVDGLEESLGDLGRKRRVWSQFKQLHPQEPAW